MLIKGTVPANGKRVVQEHLLFLLQNCNSLNALIQIHTQVLLNGLSHKNILIAKLLSFYIASGHLRHAHHLFAKMDNPTTTVWNHVIRGYARSHMPWKSIQCYSHMLSAEVLPDVVTYSSLLSACARGGLEKEGAQLHATVLVKGYCSNVFVDTSLINFYARHDGVQRARHVFDDMAERSVVSWNSILAGYVRCGDFDGAIRVFDAMPCRNVVSWTTMVAGCAQNGKCRQALLLFGEMRRARVELDQVALVAALSACAELGDLKLGRWIHWYVQQCFVARNQQPSVRLSNALIHMYASCGIIHEAYQVFVNMPWKSTVSWTSMIMAFAKQGLGKEALYLFKTMLSDGVGVNGVSPDEITFIGVLCACSHAGFVEEGRQIFDSMKHTWGINPRIEHYGCMVDLLSRAGFLDEARGLIETMPLKPNDALWGALLGGCHIHKNSELASQVENKLVVPELSVDQAAGYLVLLSNIYAFGQRWQDVITVRQKMIEMGVKKPPGRSWIQINGVVHNFVAGDMTHKHSHFIYEILYDVSKQANLEGYGSEINVFLDIEV